MENTIEFIPASGYSLSSGRIVRQTISVTLKDASKYVQGSTIKIIEINNIDIYVKENPSNPGVYEIPFVQDLTQSNKISATFYYSVADVVGAKASFKAISDYFDSDQLVSNQITEEINATFTNPTSYLFTVSIDPNPDPDNSPTSTAEYSVNVFDENNSPVFGYDVYWYDSVKDGVLAYSHVFIDNDVNPDNPTRYSPVKPIDVSSMTSPVGTAIYHTKTDANATSTIYVTSSKRAVFGAPNVFASPQNDNSLGIITIYDPENPIPLLGMPYMLGQSYTIRGNINLNVMPDPIQVRILDYQNSSDSDNITLISNGMLVDSSSYKELVGTGKMLNLSKSTLYTVDGNTPNSSQNKLVYVVAASDGTVRTSMYNKFYAEGVTNPNQPDPSILRYPPAPELPYVDGIYITKDDIIGGVSVHFPFTNPEIKLTTNHSISTTYYVNGYVSGTMIPRRNKISRGNIKITNDDLTKGFYEDTLTAYELQGYSKSNTGGFLKLYIEYTITDSITNRIYNFFYNDHYFMSTVAPGDFNLVK